MHIIYENTISKAPDVVFPWIANPDKAMQWQQNVKGGKIITDSPEVIGTTFTEIIEEEGKRLEMQGVITQYLQDKVIGFHIESRIHSFDVSYTLCPEDNGAKLVIDVDIAWKFPMNIMSLFMGKKMKNSILNQLATEVMTLKKICEEE